MDKLTAYKILGLSNDASPEDIKEAYASLSKKYHPEENPEEFQQIHEAYVTLTRRGRRNQGVASDYSSKLDSNTSTTPSDSALVFRNITAPDEKPQESTTSSDFAFEKSIQRALELEAEAQRLEQERIRLNNEQEAEKLRIKMEKIQQEKERLLEEARQEQRQKYDFDSSISQAEKEEQEREWQLVMQLLSELKELLTPPACHQIKNFKAYFGRTEYQKFFYNEIFISNLAQLLKQIDLKPEIYSYLIKVYRLKDKDPAKLIPEAKRLYVTINNCYSIKQDPVAAKRRGAIGGGLGALIFSLFRYGPKLAKVFLNANSNFATGFLGLVPFVILVGGCLLLYKLFCRKHSTYKAQKYVAISLMLFSIVTFIFNLWAPFFPNSDSDGPTTSICAVIIGFMWWIAMEFILLVLKKKRQKE